MQRAARLKIIDPFNAEKSVDLRPPSFTIGRDAGNDLQMLSDKVSRQHLVIICENGVFSLSDSGSTNGTFVNDQRVTQCLLHHGDRLCIGGDTGYQIQFIQEYSGEGAASEEFTAASPNLEGSASAKEELDKLLRFVEVNRAFKFSMTPEEVLSLVVDAAIEMSRADRGFLMLKNSAGELTFRIARDRRRRTLTGSEFSLSHSAVIEAYQQDRNVIISDNPDSGVSSSQSMLALELRTVICIPLHRFRMSEMMNLTMLTGREVIGVLYVDSRGFGGALSKTSVALLEALSFEASKCLESIRLMQEEQEKLDFQREFEMASKVQEALLPAAFSISMALDVAADSIPCRYVGGDFYDAIALPDGQSVLVLGDVCGKGIAAALLASMAQGILQAQLTTGRTLPEAVSVLNRVLIRKAEASQFITLFCVEIDRSGCLSWVNAGHNPPMLIRKDGRSEHLQSDSIVLGVFENAEYRMSHTRMEPGDLLVAFSDGVTEAENSAQEMFGEKRLEQLLLESRNCSASEIKDLLVERIAAFTAGRAQSDDITLMVLKMPLSVL